jgi:hypothetical protein
MPSRRAPLRKTARIDDGHKPYDAGEKARDERLFQMFSAGKFAGQRMTLDHH